MKKSIIMLLLFTTICAFGFAQGQEEGAAEEKTYVFKFAHSMSEQSVRHQSMELFKKELEEKTNGRIKVEIYANGVLGSESEVIDMVKTNNVQGARGSQFEKANPKYMIYNIPFVFNSADEFKYILHSDFEEAIAKDAQKNGYYIPATGIAGGFRQFTNNVRPINTPDDIKGLKMRVPPLEPVLKAMDALSANPQQVPYKETYMALKTGVVDGQENPFSNTYDMNFDEVQKYLSIGNYIICPDCLFVSNTWYQALPDDLKTIFNEVSKEAMDWSTENWLASEEPIAKELEQNLITNVISDENLQLFRDKMGPVYDYFINKGDFTQADLDDLNSRLEEYRANH